MMSVRPSRKRPSPPSGDAVDATSSAVKRPCPPAPLPAAPPPSKRLPRSFFDKPVLELARELLGKRLVHRDTSGLIVETEAYAGKDDPSAHSYRGKTERNAAMFAAPGTLYVYSIYGCYCCANVSSRGEGCAVLLRALQPDGGLDEMRRGRTNPKTGKAPDKERDLCNGPSKLCQALGVTKELTGLDMCADGAAVWLEEATADAWPPHRVVQSTRIGIEGAGEAAAAMPYRFYALGNSSVSKRDQKAEKALLGAEK